MNNYESYSAGRGSAGGQIRERIWGATKLPQPDLRVCCMDTLVNTICNIVHLRSVHLTAGK